MTTSQGKLFVDKGKTYISLTLVISGAGALLWLASSWARVQAQVEQNTKDIQSVNQKIETLGNKLDTTNDNLVTTNENVIRLNASLEKE